MIDEKKLIEDIDNCVVGLTNIQIMQIADIIETQPKVGEWIPCQESLPKDYQKVLTCDEKGNIHIMQHHHSFKYPFNISSNHPYLFQVVKWMPLPET